jgi:hypothetical protein
MPTRQRQQTTYIERALTGDPVQCLTDLTTEATERLGGAPLLVGLNIINTVAGPAMSSTWSRTWTEQVPDEPPADIG